jgi:hypothetical protein
MVRRALALAAVAALLGATPCAAQRDSVLDAIWREGMQGSRVEPLAQALLDSIGPRLTGTPGEAAARAWVLARYREWGVGARDEKYGTGPGGGAVPPAWSSCRPGRARSRRRCSRGARGPRLRCGRRWWCSPARRAPRSSARGWRPPPGSSSWCRHPSPRAARTTGGRAGPSPPRWSGCGASAPKPRRRGRRAWPPPASASAGSRSGWKARGWPECSRRTGPAGGAPATSTTPGRSACRCWS